MSETPNPDATIAGPNPFEKPTQNGTSIVDTILDLDEFLSGDVRLAEKTVYFNTEPQLEAEIDALEAKLEEITDEMGRPIDGGDASVADGKHPALQLADKIQTLRARLQASRRGVRVRQLPADEWTAFRTKHRKTLEDAFSPQRQAMWNELIVACAVAPTFTLQQIQKLRRMIGDPQVGELESGCFEVCTKSGVSVPKSPLSSHVLRQQTREQS